MDKVNLIKPEKINLLNHPTLNEKWVQEAIAKDPSILGLGELILKDKERIQPKAGRLDLLLQDPETNRRYEVEIQLGKVDEGHIIRTIEYWDIERKRYPQYDHCAVIIAEDITSRFLNIISIFNGFIPLIAIQMNAYKVKDDYFLLSTTVLDEMSLGLLEEEEIREVTDRNYWETVRGTKKTVAIADELLNLISEFAPGYELKYNKFYIGLAKDKQPDNFVIFIAKKSSLNMELRLKQSGEIEKMLEDAGLDLMNYDKRWGRYPQSQAKFHSKSQTFFHS
uniref:DUF5655 domain-containing protein n=1 Tax=Candidatus Methanophaga sp. ANME-1 ERB7 TaxID=2759913 RepID=A0A7G9Z382_9EURY|nr:hypothetical protein PDBAIGND_00022 [Methanosarcinales archaeon ANME-1 ERB7]